MNLEIITRDEFNSFKKEILEALNTKVSNQDKKYLRSSEVRKLLNVSAGTLQNLRINGTLPYSKVGTTLLYDKDEIIKVFEGNKSN